jgi:hypothetical protein
VIGLSVKATVITADSAETVRSAIEDNQDGTVALFFIDSSLNQGSESGFWNNMVTSITHVFSGEDSADAQQQQIDSIERDISQEVALVTIDVSNEELREIQESYDVTTVPFLIVFKRGIVVLKEVPTHETHDKILQVLNVNPAAVHADEEITLVTSTETSSSAPEPYTTSFEFEESGDVEEQPVAAPVVTVYGPAAASTRPVNFRDERHITLAPGEKERRVQVEEQHVNPDDRRKFVHHQCHDVTTYDDEAAKHWRTSPFYVSELEDYEIPEDWWRNGYTPITDPERQQKKTPEVVPVSIRPSYVYERPVVEPVRFVEPARVVEPVRPQVVYEPRTRPRSFVAEQITPVAVSNITTNYTVVPSHQVVSPHAHVIPTAPHVHVVEPREFVTPVPVTVRNSTVVTRPAVSTNTTSTSRVVTAAPTTVRASAPVHTVQASAPTTVRTAAPVSSTVRTTATTASTAPTATRTVSAPTTATRTVSAPRTTTSTAPTTTTSTRPVSATVSPRR